MIEDVEAIFRMADDSVGLNSMGIGQSAQFYHRWAVVTHTHTRRRDKRDEFNRNQEKKWLTIRNFYSGRSGLVILTKQKAEK